MEDIERKRGFLINTVYAVVVGLIYYILVRYVMYALMPFTIALLVTFMLKRPVDHISRFLHIPRRGVAAAAVLLFYGLIVALLTHGAMQLIVAVVDWFASLSDTYASSIEPAVRTVVDWYEGIVASIDPERLPQVEGISNDILSNLTRLIGTISSKFVGYAQNMAVGVPKFFISLVFCLISTVFMSMDYSPMTYFFLAQFSEEKQKTIIAVKNYLLSMLAGMFKSYGLIMLITMCELMIGFRIIGLENGPLYAVIIGIFDILPALGTGGVMVPWVLIKLLTGDYTTALQLLVLYVIVTVVRNIIEPKVVGISIGLHPVLLLMSLYVGGAVLGPAGIVVLPFTLVVVKKLNDAGHIRVFNSDYFGNKDAAFKSSYKTGSIVRREDRASGSGAEATARDKDE